MLPRNYDDYFPQMEGGRVYIIFGARQVGKTTLMKTIVDNAVMKNAISQPSDVAFRYRVESGDNALIYGSLSSGNFKDTLAFAEELNMLVIDEAQKIPNIGLALKILVDNRPDLFILVSGSSSFELAGQVGEPLTGRKRTLFLYPLSIYELSRTFSGYELNTKLNDFLIYGMYPEVLTAPSAAEKKRVLNEITGSYLLKDILELDKIKSSKTLLDLLRLLAWQTGSEVNLTELGQKLSLDKKTVARYIGLLQQTFIIYEVRGFSGNLRKEITKKSKYYFYDVGIRNMLINDFTEPGLRPDTGSLWENFLMSERVKTREYTGAAPGFSNESRFWRTYDQKEIDLIETRAGGVYAYEFKWSADSKKANRPFPKDFTAAYPEAKCTIINRENWMDFLLSVAS